MTSTKSLKSLMSLAPAQGAWPRIALAFVLAWLAATAWGSLVQTQFNLQALARLGVEIPLRTRALVSAQDLVGFGPVYAGIVLAAWLPALAVALVVSRRWPASRAWAIPLAAGVGLIVAVKAADALAPMPVLIDATRGLGGLLSMAAGCVLAGVLLERRTRRVGV